MARMTHGRAATVIGAVAIAIAAACGGGGVTESGPGPVTPVDTTKPGGPVVQRGSMTVQVDLDADDAALASAVGITRAGLTVRIKRDIASEPAVTAVTGLDGIARFEGLLEGRYSVSVDRALTSAEVALLPVADRDVGILAAGTDINFQPPGRQVSLSLVASRRGSLVISELFGFAGGGSAGFYQYASYLEVYNASDTTIYLDGVVVASTWGGMHFVRPDRSCETFNADKRLDPDRLWISIAYAFPGSGREYPIQPGQAKVMAMDALDHTAAAPGQPVHDLSRADFEQQGTDADIDNPFVPNMRRLRGGTGVLGRGHNIAFGQAYALLLPSAASQMQPGVIDGMSGGGFEAATVPRATVLDVAAIDFPATTYAFSGFVGCRPFLAPVFDRNPSVLGVSTVSDAIARKSLGRTPSGLEILQRTRTSSRDFEYVSPLRRSLNKL